MESFKPNQPTIYIKDHTKTLFGLPPLCPQALRYLLHEFLFVIIFASFPYIF